MMAGACAPFLFHNASSAGADVNVGKGVEVGAASAPLARLRYALPISWVTCSGIGSSNNLA